MRRVDPVEAREGTFIKSFPVREFQDMLNYGHDTEMAMFKHRVKGDLVFTRIGMGTQPRQFDTWQIFLLEERPDNASA